VDRDLRLRDGREGRQALICFRRARISRHRDSKPTEGSSMSAEGEALVSRFFEEFCNGRRAEVADEIVAEDYVSQAPQAPPAEGPEGIKARVGLYQDAVDGQWDVQELLSTGDRVVARWTGCGTHRGELMGLEPTGRTIEVDAISVFRI